MSDTNRSADIASILLDILKQHDRCPIEARDGSRRVRTAKLIMQALESYLSDPEKRQRYDETGTVDDQVDTTDSQAMSIIAAFVGVLRRSHAALSSELDRLREENERLRGAVSFYAEPSNYIDSPSWDGDPSCITEKCIPVSMEEGRPCDCGDVARAALSPDNSTQKKEG